MKSSLENHGRVDSLRLSDAMVGAARAKSLFFLAAGLSMVLSIYLFFWDEPIRGVFVGLWVPSILAAGALLMSRGPRHE